MNFYFRPVYYIVKYELCTSNIRFFLLLNISTLISRYRQTNKTLIWQNYTDDEKKRGQPIITTLKLKNVRAAVTKLESIEPDESRFGHVEEKG